MSENILEMQNVTTCVNEGTSEEKETSKKATSLLYWARTGQENQLF